MTQGNSSYLKSSSSRPSKRWAVAEWHLTPGPAEEALEDSHATSSLFLLVLEEVAAPPTPACEV